jgi:hypothetical protein
LPDVRQKGRQKTCGPTCRKEHHRRQCKKWNGKNKADFKSNYLSKKIEKAVAQPPPVKVHSFQQRAKPVLPMDVIVTEYGIKSTVILKYLIGRIIDYTRVDTHRSP